MRRPNPKRLIDCNLGCVYTLVIKILRNHSINTLHVIIQLKLYKRMQCNQPLQSKVLWRHILIVKYLSGVSLTSEKSIKPPVNGEKCSALVIWLNGTGNFGIICESSSPDSEDITTFCDI